MKCKAVIFDMDGTLTDSEKWICRAAMAMFKEKGVTVVEKDFVPFIGMGENRYLGGVAEKYNLKTDISQLKNRTYEIYLNMIRDGLEAYPGAHHLFHRIREEGLKLAIASSADKIKVHANLKAISIPPEQWDVIVTGEDVTLPKPSPDIFILAARLLKCAPYECTVIEDSPAGVEAAKLADMRCIAVLHTHTEENLKKADVIKWNLLNIHIAHLSDD